MNEVFKYNGKDYMPKENGCCFNCVFFEDELACEKSDEVLECLPTGIIWIEKQTTKE